MLNLQIIESVIGKPTYIIIIYVIFLNIKIININ